MLSQEEKIKERIVDLQNEVDKIKELPPGTMINHFAAYLEAKRRLLEKYADEFDVFLKEEIAKIEGKKSD